MDNLHFSQLVDKPTGITAKTSTRIDHVFTNNVNTISEVCAPCYAISDHVQVALTRKVNSHVSTNQGHNFIYYRSIKQFHELEFLNDVYVLSWSIVLNTDDPNQSYQNFVGWFTSVLQKHASLKKLIVKPRIVKSRIVKSLIQSNWMNSKTCMLLNKETISIKMSYI